MNYFLQSPFALLFWKKVFLFAISLVELKQLQVQTTKQEPNKNMTNTKVFGCM